MKTIFEWELFKDYVHSKRMSLNQLATAAHTTVNTIKRKFIENDKDFLLHIDEVLLHECR